MNLSEPTTRTDGSKAALESLRDWWALAGVDTHYSDGPTALAQPVKQPAEAPRVALSEDVAPDKPVTKNAETIESAASNVPSVRFPDDYDQFIAWLDHPDNLVESRWARQMVQPQGALQPEVMIIVAMPEQGREISDSCFSNSSAALLDRIWQAIGCDSEKIFSAPACFARPTDGRIDQTLQNYLKTRMLHLIGLVQPQKIIIFGDQASEMFFGQNILSARKLKQFINHSSSKTDAIATFHPRILVQRPEFKAETWKDLQLLMRNPAP